VQVFERIAVQHDYEILLTSTGDDPKRMESSVRRMIERRVEGVAIIDLRHGGSAARGFEAAKSAAGEASEYTLKTNLVLRESTSLVASAAKRSSGKRLEISSS
jgi:hypothetical protein